MKLLLIRHPKPEVPEGTCYGRTDVPAQAAHLDTVADALRRRWSTTGGRPHRVFSSPLSRCSALAHALSRDADWPVPVLDHRIAEMHFGHWEGRPWSEIPSNEMQAWRADIGRVAPPGGESLADVAERLLAFTQACLSDTLHPAAEVVVFTHVGVIQTALRVLRGEPMNGFGRTQIDFGSISTLARRDGRFEIESVGVAP